MSQHTASARKARLMPNDVPRYIRCYDNGGKTFDRYTVISTKRRIEPHGPFAYVGMSDNPYHPHGFGHHGEIDRPTLTGDKRITFADLPRDCQTLVLSDYRAIWGIK